MEMIDKFLDGYEGRQKKILNDNSDEIQKKYEGYSKKWNNKDLN
jgi:hypothetical protein